MDNQGAYLVFEATRNKGMRDEKTEPWRCELTRPVKLRGKSIDVHHWVSMDQINRYLGYGWPLIDMGGNFEADDKLIAIERILRPICNAYKQAKRIGDEAAGKSKVRERGTAPASA